MFGASISLAISLIGADLDSFCHLQIYAWFANAFILLLYCKNQTDAEIISELTGPNVVTQWFTSVKLNVWDLMSVSDGGALRSQHTPR